MTVARAKSDKVTQVQSEGEAVCALACPICGDEGSIGELDTVTAVALIAGVGSDGDVIWDGHTDIVWDEQKSSTWPPTYLCLGCGTEFTAGQLGIIEP